VVLSYAEFDAEYGRLLAAAGGMDDAMLASELTRMRALQWQLADESERELAGASLATLEDVLTVTSEPSSDAMVRAVAALSRAGDERGTPQERVERARAGMDEIARIAETADPAERNAILDMTESLAMLIDALEPDADRGPEPR
jgi:hypothetical protein